MYTPHQNSEYESINIDRIHYHINNLTPSGVKIIEAFVSEFPLETIFFYTVESGANRSTHYDLLLIFDNGSKTVEFKGSKHHKCIDSSKHPWVYGVQFYNGTGSKFTIAHRYVREFYDYFIDKAIQHFQIQTPKPTYEEWSKDAFKQGKPSTPFVCELREKGYKSTYLSDCRKQFNKNFIANTEDLMTLMDEVQHIANEALSCKDYWLQIHGNIDNPDSFYVKWSAKIIMPQIQTVSQIISKDHCDINFKFICSDGTEFMAKLRWGYGQCITNIRVDIK